MATSGELIGSHPQKSDRRAAFLDQIESVLSLCEARLANPVAWITAVCAALALQAALILTHRPWSDEWQALLIARDTPTLGSMLAQLHYEGHPQLWYLLLRAVGRAIPADWVLPAIDAALAAITFWAILFRSPFLRIERLLLVTNEILVFEMLTVSRSLALGVALLFLVLAFWRSRFVWFAIALLPLCDFFLGVIACALIAIRIRDREDESLPFLGWALFAACSLLAASAVTPAKDVLTTPPRGWLGTAEFLHQVGGLAVPLQTYRYDTPPPLALAIMLAPIFLFVCFDALRKDRLAQVLLFGFLGLLLLFGCAIYPIYFRHTALAAVLLIALVWIGALKNHPKSNAFGAWLSVAALCGVATSALNLFVPFDTAAQAATMIREHKLADKLWFSFPTFQTLALTGESGIDFGDLERDCSVGFMRWNFRTHIDSHTRFFAAVRAAERRYGSFYLVTNVPLPPIFGRSLGTVHAGYDGVQYRLWKVGNSAASEARLPSCVPGTTPTRSAPAHEAAAS